MTKHDRYNHSEKGRARWRRYWDRHDSDPVWHLRTTELHRQRRARHSLARYERELEELGLCRSEEELLAAGFTKSGMFYIRPVRNESLLGG
jgi:hypothetical protein